MNHLALGKSPHKLVSRQIGRVRNFSPLMPTGNSLGSVDRIAITFPKSKVSNARHSAGGADGAGAAATCPAL